MRVAQAKLIKRQTDDGLFGFLDDVPIGRIYRVNLDSRMTIRMYNVEYDVVHEKECVLDVDHPHRTRGEGWLALECLQLLDAGRAMTDQYGPDDDA